MTIAAMVKAHPNPPDLDPERWADALERLQGCATACTQCADACLAEDEVTALRRCIALDLDCAEVCGTTARVLARLTERPDAIVRSLLEACAASCAACAAECEGHGEHMEHCRICAEECRRCEQACRGLLTAMG